MVRDSVFFKTDEVYEMNNNDRYKFCVGFVLPFNGKQYAVTIGLRKDEQIIEGILTTNDDDFLDVIEERSDTYEI